MTEQYVISSLSTEEWWLSKMSIKTNDRSYFLQNWQAKTKENIILESGTPIW